MAIARLSQDAVVFFLRIKKRANRGSPRPRCGIMQRASAGTDGSHTKRSWFYDGGGGGDCQLVFANGGESRNVALEFLEFVTDRRFLEIVTLGDFRKKRICGRGAIIFFGVCHRPAVPRLRDIR